MAIGACRWIAVEPGAVAAEGGRRGATAHLLSAQAGGQFGCCQLLKTGRKGGDLQGQSEGVHGGSGATLSRCSVVPTLEVGNTLPRQCHNEWGPVLGGLVTHTVLRTAVRFAQLTFHLGADLSGGCNGFGRVIRRVTEACSVRGKSRTANNIVLSPVQRPCGRLELLREMG